VHRHPKISIFAVKPLLFDHLTNLHQLLLEFVQSWLFDQLWPFWLCNGRLTCGISFFSHIRPIFSPHLGFLPPLVARRYNNSCKFSVRCRCVAIFGIMVARRYKCRHCHGCVNEALRELSWRTDRTTASGVDHVCWWLATIVVATANAVSLVWVVQHWWMVVMWSQ